MKKLFAYDGKIVSAHYLKQRAGKRLNMHPKHEPVTKPNMDRGVTLPL
jgi:hypothetical protein